MTEDKLKIAIIDYESGNLRSVQKAIEKHGAEATISSDPNVIRESDGIVFPGQGACDSSMVNLRNKSLDTAIVSIIKNKKPFLGVCLGLQLLLEESEEGLEPCLGVFKGTVKKLPSGLKIPHMGWNQVQLDTTHPVFKGIPKNANFYFVHSFYADPESESIICGKTTYGIDFCSAIAIDNVIATQFHPEKSGNIGIRIYGNFVQFVSERKVTLCI